MPRTTVHTIHRPESLTDIVASYIRKAIIEGEFELGQPISENMLVERYAISKTPIKLALVRLSMEGLVEIFPQRGSFVFSMTPDDMCQLEAWRMAIEDAALLAAYTGNRRSLIKVLDSIYKKMCKARDKHDWTESFALDAEFHRSIVLCSNNKYLLNSYDANIYKMNALLFRFASTPWDHPERFEEHNAIIDALRNNGLQTARDLLAAHIEHLSEQAFHFENVPDSSCEK